MVPGGPAGLAAEEGGRTALHVRINIGSLEVTLKPPRHPSGAIPHHPGEPVRNAGMLTQQMWACMRRGRCQMR